MVLEYGSSVWCAVRFPIARFKLKAKLMILLTIGNSWLFTAKVKNDNVINSVVTTKLQRRNCEVRNHHQLNSKNYQIGIFLTLLWNWVVYNESRN